MRPMCYDNSTAVACVSHVIAPVASGCEMQVSATHNCDGCRVICQDAVNDKLEGGRCTVRWRAIGQDGQGSRQELKGKG